MPVILKQLLGSEKLWYVILLWQLPMMALMFMGRVGVDAWREDALWALGILVGGKTLQGSASVLRGGKKTDA